MEIEFKLIKYVWFKTILRPLNLLLVFLPIYSYDKIDYLIETNFWGIWGSFWIIIFFLQIGFINRYKIIGEIKMNTKYINITIGNNISYFFTPDQKLGILIEYNGFKGEKGNYKGPLQLPILTRDGIGLIEITREKNIYKYTFLSQRNNSKRLITLKDFYENEGSKVGIIWN